jgi:hypothetical protein
MPLYFFNVRGVRKSSDNVGEELPDNEAAWEEATIIAAELFRDIDGRFQPGQQWTLEVPTVRGSRSTSSTLVQEI